MQIVRKRDKDQFKRTLEPKMLLTSVRTPHTTKVTSTSSSTTFGASSALHVIFGIAIYTPRLQLGDIAADYQIRKCAETDTDLWEAMNCLQASSVVIPFQTGEMTSEAMTCSMCRTLRAGSC